MNDLFSINSPIVTGTLLLLILLSIATWSIALFKLWKQWKSRKHDQSFTERFWSAQEWSRLVDTTNAQTELALKWKHEQHKKP